MVFTNKKLKLFIFGRKISEVVQTFVGNLRFSENLKILIYAVL